MRVMIVGGGTGGHVIPALAIARELQARFNAEVEFIGTPRGMENRLVPQAGFTLNLVQVGALKNVSLLTRARTLTDLPRAVAASVFMLRRFKPQVVIGVGGYASGPGMLAAGMLRIPALAFEPNLVPGFANRMVAPLVKAAAVHFAETASFFHNAEITGVPVRKEFFSIAPRPAGAAPSLLVTGGSQGSRALNRVMVESLAALARHVPGIQIFHQTGEREYETVRAAYEASGMDARVSAFIEDMPRAFADADILLCRSGAGTVAEITAAGKVAIFVPFPHAADDHQRRNAEALSSRNAAVIIPESELASENLVPAVARLLNDPGRIAQMSLAARAVSHADAAAHIATIAARLAAKK